MALPVEKLESALTSALRQIGNVHSTLLDEGITVSVSDIDVQVNLIAPMGEGAVEIKNVTVTPARTSKTKQTSKSTKGAQSNRSDQTSSSSSNSTQTEDSTQTQQYGRQTIGETTYED